MFRVNKHPEPEGADPHCREEERYRVQIHIRGSWIQYIINCLFGGQNIKGLGLHLGNERLKSGLQFVCICEFFTKIASYNPISTGIDCDLRRGPITYTTTD